MQRLTEENPRNRQAIFPYIGGEEVNTSPTHAHHRYVINFRDYPLRRKEKVWEAREGVGGHGRKRTTNGAGIRCAGKTAGNQRTLESHGRTRAISGASLRYTGKTSTNRGRTRTRSGGGSCGGSRSTSNAFAAFDQRSDAPESMNAIDAFRADAWTRQDPRLLDDFVTLTPHRQGAHPDDDAQTGSTQAGISLGWEDIRDLPEDGTVIRRITDDALPGSPTTREIVYPAPFDRTGREPDYRAAWREFICRFREICNNE